VVRVYAAEALWTINRNQSEVLPALLEVIRFRTSWKENRKAQLRAVRVIEKMGDLNTTATEALSAFQDWRHTSARVAFKMTGEKLDVFDSLLRD